MKLSTLLNGFVAENTEIPDVFVKHLVIDSRNVQPGDVFFAYQGTNLDGRVFIADALKQGAVAVLIDAGSPRLSASPPRDDSSETFDRERVIPIPHLKISLGKIAARFYGEPTESMRIVGVTGTSGKTSCSHFIADALTQLHVRCGIIGTLGIGLYGHVKPGSLTTPDAITLQKTFAEFLAQDIKTAVMEVSSHSIDQERIRGMDFTLGVFTNLSRDHLDYHGTMEAYGATKKRLFDLVKYSVVNADDALGREIIADFAHKKNVYAYSSLSATHSNAGNNALPLTYPAEVHLTSSGIEANIITPWGEGFLQAPLIGQFNVSNVLAVLTSLCLLEVPLQTALKCISSLRSVPGRMQTMGGHHKPLVVVDYAHKPDALEKVLIALRAHCHGKLFCVFGCGGERDKGKRPMMAKIAETYADQVIVTDDNPRHEDAKQIVADILQGFVKPEKIIVQQDREKAIRDVIAYASAGDCILIAGKGAETYQQIGDEKIPFSDVEKVNACLA